MTLSLPVVVIAVLLLGLLAGPGGTPVTRWVLRRAEGGAPPTPPGVKTPAQVLRGGRTIGDLERAAIFIGLACGYPEVFVGVITLKGLGRFAELRGDTEGTAERFIIGSFTSLLWSGIFGGLARLAILHVG